MSKKRKTTGMPKKQNITQSPSDKLIQQGKAAFRRKEYDQAIMRWQMARSLPSLSAEKREPLNAALAEAYFRRGTQHLKHNPAVARENLQQAVQLRPADALYAYYVGLSWHRADQHEQAIKVYRRTLEIDPAFARAANALALALVQSGQDVTRDPVWNQLEAEQQAYLQRKPTSTPLSQAFVLMANDQWDEAEPLIDAALDGDMPAMAHYYRGVLDARAGNDDAALEHWQKAHDADLHTPYLVNNLTLAYTLCAESALVEDRTDEALAYARKGLAVDLTHPRLSDIQATILFERGYRAAEQGDWNKALAAWENIENAIGANARALAANIALAYEKIENEIEAAEAWREFARRRPRKEGAEGWLSPQQVARLWTRISHLYLKAGWPEEAITTLQTALKYEPDDIDLGLSLANAYISDDRSEAAHNQLDRMLEKQPDHLQTLVLKAELSEAVPPERWYFPGMSEPPGVRQWKKVLESGDETYVPIAKKRIMALYEEAFDDAWRWGGPPLARKQAETAFEVVPDHHFLRARYVHLLLQEKPRGKKAQKEHEANIQAQVALIDLTDEEALHQLIDAWHIAGRHKDAAATLETANDAHPLGPDFYLGIGACAVTREQDTIAQGYFDEAVKRAQPADRLKYKARVGLHYASSDEEGRAETIWKQVLEEDPDHGYAHYYLWILNHRGSNQRQASKHLKAAKAWADKHQDMELKANIAQTEETFNNPMRGLFSMLPPGIDPSQLPPGMLDDILGGILGGEFLDDEDYDDDDDFDFDLPFFGRGG